LQQTGRVVQGFSELQKTGGALAGKHTESLSVSQSAKNSAIAPTHPRQAKPHAAPVGSVTFQPPTGSSITNAAAAEFCPVMGAIAPWGSQEEAQLRWWDMMRDKAVLEGAKHDTTLPFVTTPDEAVSAAVGLAGVQAGDVFLDLGCGDGRLMVAAASCGATAVGIDYDSALLKKAKKLATSRGVASRCSFHKGDFMQAKFYEPSTPWAKALESATVVFLFGNDTVVKALEPCLLQLKARIVTYHWHLNTVEPVAFTRGGALRLFLGTGELNLLRAFQDSNRS